MNVSIQGVGRCFDQKPHYNRTYGENVSYCTSIFPHYSIFLLVNSVYIDISDRINIVLIRFSLGL